MKIKIGQNIRKIRELKGFTQEVLAEKLNMSQNAYSKLERGKSDMRLDKWLNVAEKLNINFVDLINFDENKLLFNQTSYNNSNGVVFTQHQNIDVNTLKQGYEAHINDLKKEITFLRDVVLKDNKK